MAVEKVLNQYCSDSDPSRPALKKVAGGFARLVYVV